MIKGFILGMLFVVIYIIVLIAMRQLEFRYRPFTINAFYTLLSGIIIFGGVAFAEEITFRGYFQNILSKNNKNMGLILTAMLFAINHLINIDNYTLLSLIYLAIGGILLGLIRMETENIWFPIGFHIAWNWTEIRVFGLGNPSNHHWFSTEIIQNTIWNGGESGTGLVIVFVELIFIVIFTYLYSRKNRK